ncbi:MAG: hypothetical protein MJ209_02565 [archaeon]|nr:hypothetical protein [archaeon]
METHKIIVNQAAACQSIGWEVYNQDDNDLNPVLGLVDLAGRKTVRPFIGDDYFNLSFP